MKKKEEPKEINVNFKTTDIFRDKYHEFCKKKGYSMSGRIRVLLEKDLAGEIK